MPEIELKTLAEVNISSKKRETAAVKIQRKFKDFLFRKRKALANLTWMTGTNGNYLFPGLLRTKFKMRPTGEGLLANRIAPPGGEVSPTEGLSFDGVNQTGLSGVTPQDFTDAWDYAETRYVQDVLSLNEREQDLIEAINEIIEDLSKGVRKRDLSSEGEGLSDIIYLTLIILRLRQLNGKLYYKIHSKLENLLYELKDLRVWIQTENRDQVLLWLQRLEAAIKKGSAFEWSAEDREWLSRTKHLPVVLGTTQKSEKMHRLQEEAEVIYEGDLTVGEDLTVLITDEDKENQNIVRRYLRKHGLRSKVFVCTEQEYRPFEKVANCKRRLEIFKEEYLCYRNNLDASDPDQAFEIDEMQKIAEMYLKEWQKIKELEDQLGATFLINDPFIIDCLVKDGFAIYESKLTNEFILNDRPPQSLIFTSVNLNTKIVSSSSETSVQNNKSNGKKVCAF